MSEESFDAFLEITLTVHRHVRITAPDVKAASEKAQALADAWMPHQLTSQVQWPATEKPAITVGFTVLKSKTRPERKSAAA